MDYVITNYTLESLYKKCSACSLWGAQKKIGFLQIVHQNTIRLHVFDPSLNDVKFWSLGVPCI